MAFSMFLRNVACTSRTFNQQVMKLATQPALTRHTVSSSLPISVAVKEIKCTPLINTIRSFRTSTVRLSDEKPHDHAKLWVVEKMTSALMVPLVPIALLIPNKIFDSVLAILIVAHSFWGLEAIVVEYLRVLVVGSLVPKVAMTIVYIVTAVNLGGLLYLNFNDIGLSRSFWKIWKNMKKPRSAPAPPPPPPPPPISSPKGPGGDSC